MNYRKLWEKHYGPIPVDEQGVSYEIHHIDGNRRNNCLNNLRCVSIEEHLKIHQRQKDEIACHAIRLRMKAENLKGWQHTEEMKKRFSETRKGRKHSIESIEKMKTSRIGMNHSTKTKNKISEASKIPIIHNETGIVFDSGKSAALALKVAPGSIIYRVKKGEFRYITKDEYEKRKKIKGLVKLKKCKGGDTQKKKMQHIATKQIYESVTEAANAFSIAPSNMSYYIRKKVFKYL